MNERTLSRTILDLTNRVDGQDIVDLVSKTGRTDRGVTRVVNKLIKANKLVVTAGRFSSHSALTI